MNNWQIVAVVAVVTIALVVVGIRALLRGRRVPAKAKLVLAAAILWLLSPLDILPDVAFPAGLIDDIAVLAAAVRYLLDQAEPRDAGPSVRQRLSGRQVIDAVDWRISDDPSTGRG